MVFIIEALKSSITQMCEQIEYGILIKLHILKPGAANVFTVYNHHL